MKTRKTSDLVLAKPAQTAADFDNTGLFESGLEPLILALCRDVGSPLAKDVTDCLLKADYDRLLLTCDISPLDYIEASSYFSDAQICGLVKKYPFWSTSTSPKLEAIKKFIACERKCEATNEIFRSGKFKTNFSAVNEILFIAQKKISEILGAAPLINELRFEFGPGAAYGVKKNTSALDKLGSTLDVTDNCYELANEFLAACPGWRHNDDFDRCGPPKPHILNGVLGDRLSFVPKNAKTDRPIAIGPLLNVLLQKGLGTCIRQRLKPYLDLNNSQDRHKNAAYEASLINGDATVDLASASDTISIGVVEDLLPNDWFELLSRARSEYYSIEGHTYKYAKFSAMGNGYTFELETLIFYALAYAVCIHGGIETQSVSVFGDDIIIPKTAYAPLLRVLTLCGFEINSDKSFFDGPFRESCGGDFFNGTNVRPFYLKDKLTYRTLFLFHNFLVKTGAQFYFPSAYRLVRKMIGKESIQFFKTWNPLDDGALLDVSVPRCSYNTVVPFQIGRRRNRVKDAYGVAFLLYRIALFDKQGDSDVDWRTYKTPLTKVKYRLYRFLHI